MAYGNSGGTNPSFISNFPVDFALNRQPATSEAWYTVARLMQGKYLYTNDTSAEQSASNFVFDHNNGWRDGSAVTTYLNWMWKRHAGFDVVTYEGSGTGAGYQQDILHGLNAVPEMMWVKIRDAANQSWMVYHKDLNSGTNPEQYKIELNSNGAESSFSCWDNTAPTATSFRVGNQVETNHGSYNFIAMLFASVDGISKVGSYTGNGSTTGPTITTGFSPRFLIIKGGNVTGSWFVYDTTRGFASGNDQRLWLESSAAQYGSNDRVDPSSTGFEIKTNWDQFNENGKTYIYYAHA